MGIVQVTTSVDDVPQESSIITFLANIPTKGYHRQEDYNQKTIKCNVPLEDYVNIHSQDFLERRIPVQLELFRICHRV